MITVERKHGSRYDNGYDQLSTNRECINVFWFLFFVLALAKWTFIRIDVAFIIWHSYYVAHNKYVNLYQYN